MPFIGNLKNLKAIAIRAHHEAVEKAPPYISRQGQTLSSYLNTVSGIPSAIFSGIELAEGIKSRDGEEIRDSSIKFSANIISFFNGLSVCLFYATIGVKFVKNHHLFKLAHFAVYIQAVKIAAITGGILCVLDGLYEGNHLKRHLLMTDKKAFGLSCLPKKLYEKIDQLAKTLEKKRNKLTKHFTLEEQVAFQELLDGANAVSPNEIQLFKKQYLTFQLTFFKRKYLETADPKESKQLLRLLGTVAYSLINSGEEKGEKSKKTEEIDNILHLLNNTKTLEEGIERAKQFIHNIHAQRVKSSILHVLGLINVVLGLSGFITLITPVPLIVPVAMISLGYVVYFIRHGVATGWLTTTGYRSFSFTKTIPYTHEVLRSFHFTKAFFKQMAHMRA